MLPNTRVLETEAGGQPLTTSCFFFKFLHGKSLETKFDQMFFNLTQRYRRAQTSSTTVGYHAHYLDTGSRNVFF